MLKSILELKGVKKLTKEEQKSVKGGRCGNCNAEEDCCVWDRASGCFWKYGPPCV